MALAERENATRRAVQEEASAKLAAATAERLSKEVSHEAKEKAALARDNDEALEKIAELEQTVGALNAEKQQRKAARARAGLLLKYVAIPMTVAMSAVTFATWWIYHHYSGSVSWRLSSLIASLGVLLVLESCAYGGEQAPQHVAWLSAPWLRFSQKAMRWIVTAFAANAFGAYGVSAISAALKERETPISAEPGAVTPPNKPLPHAK